jgi:hypothetical protein
VTPHVRFFPAAPLRALLLLGRIAAGIALSACANVPAMSPADTARQQFSESIFCPLHRVTVARVLPVPEPPETVANDPERLAMWRDVQEGRARSMPKQTFAVSGCGQRETFACWAVEAVDGSGRWRRRVYLGASCNEQPAPAAEAAAK